MTPYHAHPDDRDDHVDVGAYVLGVLDPDDRQRFETHLAGCTRCAAEVDELSGLTPLLAELAESRAESAAGAPGASASVPAPAPGPELLDRLIAEVSTTRRRSRVRRLVLAACAALIAFGGPAATWALTQAPAQVAVAAQQFSATDAATGVSAQVGVTAKTWGSQITLALSNVNGPLTCDLVAVSPAGERQTVTTWAVPPAGYTSSTLHTAGGTALAPSAIDHFEVRTLDTGRLLVTVPTHA
ncbi:anti-sigma-L factor RslA [Kitasatospora paracochleata]|uniref:Anti-sigma-K factor RskA n=1 Tax=Kitasatospora paracochleata TaxID=58354 RepID=A0ABT1J5L9_9ACTN|nr:zf-HC2 domain-containing protein [Kitasatospora paracochleata]MCP2312419.1 anti-sigma-K factor RskA [Kitasatospora paracochleata]